MRKDSLILFISFFVVFSLFLVSNNNFISDVARPLINTMATTDTTGVSITVIDVSEEVTQSSSGGSRNRAPSSSPKITKPVDKAKEIPIKEKEIAVSDNLDIARDQEEKGETTVIKEARKKPFMSSLASFMQSEKINLENVLIFLPLVIFLVIIYYNHKKFSQIRKFLRIISERDLKKNKFIKS
jgi:hypothetical protein